MARRSLSILRDSLNKLEKQSTGDQILPLSALRISGQQPRRYFDPAKLEQLIQSIKEHGILEPLLVRPSQEDENTYEVVAGERRYRAAQQLGLLEVPVVVRELSDIDAWQIALVENLQREDLNPVEETEGVLQLLGLKLEVPVTEIPPLLHRLQHEQKKSSNNVVGNSELTVVEEVFAGLGLMSWESFVNHRLPLLNLPDDVLEALRQGKIAYTKAQAISRIKDEVARKSLLEAAISEELSLTQIKERIAELKATQAQEKTQDSQSLKSRLDEVLKIAKKSKSLTNPKKLKRWEKLLAAMEALAIED
ncbi:MAG: ParB/RepB/Spo0J family partition protein [Leptolyngbyaceae cyanobacterium bins.59]|nr:ParB/RepB/Spo0J family partition protein [Leptolyngbyaceae cyanobacterium bins.59]